MTTPPTPAGNHGPAAPGRVLITGGRDWADRATIHQQIIALPAGATIVHGACPTGADHLADLFARQLGHPIETHPADWSTHGRAAGPIRNQKMVDLGADLCIAFDTGGRGTADAIRRAQAASIPVRIVKPCP